MSSGCTVGGAWYHLAARTGILRGDDPVAGLDVSILQENLLGPVLGIGDPRTDARIEFIGGIRGMAELERLVDRDGFAVAFSLYPPDGGADDGRCGRREGDAAEIDLVRTETPERPLRSSPGVIMDADLPDASGCQRERRGDGRRDPRGPPPDHPEEIGLSLLHRRAAPCPFRRPEGGGGVHRSGDGERRRRADPRLPAPPREDPGDRHPGGARGDGEAERGIERSCRVRRDPPGGRPPPGIALRADLLRCGRLQPPLPASPVGADEPRSRKGHGAP